MWTKSQLSLWTGATSTSLWAVAQRSFFPSPKEGKDKIIAICCWSSAVTDSILFEHELNWKQFQRGVDRNCSAFSTMETSPSQISSNKEINSRVFPIWCGAQSNYFNTTPAAIFLSSMQG